MPTVTVNKQTKDMFGNNCEPCDALNHVDNLGSNTVQAGDSFYVQTKPSREYYNESLPNGFRTKTITVKDLVTDETTVYSESALGGNPEGGIAGLNLNNVQHDTEVTVDFGAGPAQSYGATGTGIDTTGGEGGGNIVFDPAPDETYDDYLQGQRLTIYNVPDEGYEVDKVTINGQDYGNQNVIELDSLTENIDVVTTFKSVACTINIVRVKRGNTAGLANVTLLGGEFGFNNETKELRIGDDEDAAKSFVNCYLLTGGGGGGTGIINPVLPVTRNCLAVWSDENGGYIKDADSNAFVKNGLFVKHPANSGYGQYKIKTYGSLDTTSYAGIIDLSELYDCSHWGHPNIGFVCNMIKNVNETMFGGGLLIDGHDERMTLTVKPTNSNSLINAIIIDNSGNLTIPNIVVGSINTSGTYNVNGVPHTHTQYLLRSGDLLSGNLNANGNSITNLKNPVNAGDAVNLGYVSGLVSGIVWQSPVEAIVSDPPVTPDNDSRFLVSNDGATGDFAGHANDIAIWNGSWYFQTPETGWALMNKATGFTHSFNGTIWIQMTSAINHNSLNGLAGDDHGQYVHLSNARVITARHTFDNVTPFLVTGTGLVQNLNVQYLNGNQASDFALYNHSHDWVALSGFNVTNPKDGEALVWSDDDNAFVNEEIAGALAISGNHIFADTIERDTYFASHMDELVQGIFIAVGSGFQMYDAGVWVNKTAVLQGPKGDAGVNGVNGETGPQGPKGDTGDEGPEGPPGNPGTSIVMRGSVATVSLLPVSGNTENDGYYCEYDGNCYVWDGDSWNNVGPIVGPRGIQGPAGPIGPQGIQGPRGLQGEIGPQGSQGIQGVQGPPGISSESWQNPVESICNTPPAIYDIGDRFIVGTSPTGAFADHANNIATYTSGGWNFDLPYSGLVVVNVETGDPLQFTGVVWEHFRVAADVSWGYINGTLTDQTDLNTALGNKVNTSLIGSSNGVAPLGLDSKIASTYLPSYVDDVIDVNGIENAPETGESGKIYLDTVSGIPYRWSGTQYAAISSSLALGETETTAYRGDRGKVAYDHSQVIHAPSNAEQNVQSDWNQTDIESDDYIKNKPTIPGEYSLPTASDTVLGGIKVGSRLTITDGVLSADEQGSSYTLPTASADTLGGVKIGSGITITNGVISANEGGSSTLVQRSLEGVVYETTLMYWMAPAACTIDSVSMSLSSNPSATGSYCKVQVMKNGTLETNSIFTADTPMQITESTSASNGIYTASGTLDSNQTTLEAGDVIQFRVNQADTGSADLLIQMKVTFT